ncbi:DUF4013 domain-containing protein [bacterium]|nr:DUF4013 domain-containing protein [bacterium]
MREAFTYMFKDNCFYKKAFVYFILSFIPMTILAIADMNFNSNSCQIGLAPVALSSVKMEALCYDLLAIFFYVLSAGYFITSLEAVIIQKTNIILPFFNFEYCLKKGFRFALSIALTLLVWGLPLLFLAKCSSIFFKGASILFGILLVLVINFLVVVFIFVLYGVFYNYLMYLYAKDGKFTTFISLRQALKFIIEPPKTYFKYWSVLILLNLINLALVYLSERLFGLFDNSYLTMVLTNIISCTLGTYSAYVSLILISKSVKTDSVV